MKSMLLLSLCGLMGCAFAEPRSELQYTIYVDAAFTPEQQLTITQGLKDWERIPDIHLTVVYNATIRKEDRDPVVNSFRELRENNNHGTVYLQAVYGKQDPRCPLDFGINPAGKTSFISRFTGFICLDVNHVGQATFRTIAGHEMGHVLGLSHSDKGVMTWNGNAPHVMCVDLMRVAEMYELNFSCSEEGEE